MLGDIVSITVETKNEGIAFGRFGLFMRLRAFRGMVELGGNDSFESWDWDHGRPWTSFGFKWWSERGLGKIFRSRTL